MSFKSSECVMSVMLMKKQAGQEAAPQFLPLDLHPSAFLALFPSRAWDTGTKITTAAPAAYSSMGTA